MEWRTLYLVRHGALAIDERERYVGQLDVPLSRQGIEQAESLRERLRKVYITRIYCSDLSRALHTAEVISAGRNLEIAPRSDLREISLGFWEGQRRSEVAKWYPLEFKTRGEDIEHYRPAGGESFADCHRRVIGALSEIMESSCGDLLIVAHAGVNRLILCNAFGLQIRNLFNIGQDYGCLNILEQRGGSTRIVLLNFTRRNALLDSDAPIEEHALSV